MFTFVLLNEFLKIQIGKMNQLKKGIFIFLMALTCKGCQYFEKKEVPSKEDLLKKELEKINWSTVDEYPSLPECENITDKELQKDCFFQVLTKTIYEKIANDSVKQLLPRLDSLKVKVTITPDSQMQFETILPSSAVNPEYTDSILRTKLVDFPTIQPAIKRGMKVKSQFVIPLFLKK